MLNEFIPLRKTQLLKLISEAKEIGANDQILFLESQWVHRYGIETLQESQKNNLDSISSIPEEYIQIPPKLEEFSSIEQENLFTQNFPESLIEDNLSFDSEEETTFEDEVMESSASDSKEEEESSSCAFPVAIAPPPPTPSVKHLRRWLPSIDDSTRKAS